jgi:hypothetical protein
MSSYTIIPNRQQRSDRSSKWPGGKHEVYFQVIQLGTADREAELAKIGRCVDQSIGFWHLKCVMDVRIRVEEFIDGTQGQFYLLIAGMCGSERHRADCGSIFVVNSVVQFVQQHHLMEEPHLGINRR